MTLRVFNKVVNIIIFSIIFILWISASELKDSVHCSDDGISGQRMQCSINSLDGSVFLQILKIICVITQKKNIFCSLCGWSWLQWPLLDPLFGNFGIANKTNKNLKS